jgi:HSP20 family molecular chaperone IbpA
VDETAIQADYKEGVLTITLPKTQKAVPKQIAISG